MHGLCTTHVSQEAWPDLCRILINCQGRLQLLLPVPLPPGFPHLSQLHTCVACRYTAKDIDYGCGAPIDTTPSTRLASAECQRQILRWLPAHRQAVRGLWCSPKLTGPSSCACGGGTVSHKAACLPADDGSWWIAASAGSGLNHQRVHVCIAGVACQCMVMLLAGSLGCATLD
jgi:hypothetical protein